MYHRQRKLSRYELLGKTQDVPSTDQPQQHSYTTTDDNSLGPKSIYEMDYQPYGIYEASSEPIQEMNVGLEIAELSTTRL